jgi:ABC-2 type transport system permease protein
LTDSQVVASSCTFVLLLLFWIVTWNEAAVSSSLLLGLSQVSTFDHFDTFARGVIDLKDVLYFLAFIGLFLGLTLQAMGSRRWRGRR